MEWKFRGWDAVGNKGWVYGDLVHNKKVTVDGLEDRVMVGGYEVVPESVGIFTGLNDMYGKRIFEGDIVYVTYVDGLMDVCSKAFVKYQYDGFVLCVIDMVKFLPLTRSVEVVGTEYEYKQTLREEEGAS